MSDYEYEYDERALPPAEDEEDVKDEIREEEEKTSDDYYELPTARSSRNMIWSVVSAVLGIASIPAAGIYALGIALALLSVGSGLFSRYRLGYFDKFSVWGLILGIMGGVCGLFSMIVSLTGIFNHM